MSKFVFDNSPFDQDNAFDSLLPPLPPAAPLAAEWGAALLSASSAAGASTSSISTSSTTTSAASATTALPSWIANIATAAIASDMKAAIVSGAVTEAGLAKLMTDLVAAVGSGKLTSAEFADLKTIAANLNTGVSTSAYLTYAFNALVNGNAANATWTGGNAASTALGNLAVGASATQISELTGKWLLGTDLPSSSVTMDGQKFSVSESLVSKSLFATSGPSMSDINQGYLGDCYFLSSCAEVANQNSADITSMFTNNGNGTYGVRFYVNGVAEYVTVNSALANGGTEFNSGADIWASLAEKAFAQFQAGGLDTGNSVNYGNSYGTIGNGGVPLNALEALTGAKALQMFYAASGSWGVEDFNAGLSVTAWTSGGLASATALSDLIADLKDHDDVVLCSNTNATASGKTTLVADHAMSIYGYDAATGLLEIRNPWGTEAGQYWDTTFEVSLTTLLSDGDEIDVDSAGGALAPIVASQTATQSFVAGKASSFSIASAFSDPLGETLSYKATQANGSALPSWLSFNASTGLFSGSATAGAGGVSVVVTATDTGGLSASETVAVNVAAASAPKVTDQTANQTVSAGKAVSIALASNTFTDPQGEALTYSATQSNGSALPSWLSFNAATEKFTGAAPSAATSLTLKVTATDTGGATTSETFTLGVTAATAASHAIAAALTAPPAASFAAAPGAVASAAVLNLLAPAA